ncbi:hypothetical protein [Dehalogenimonas alkenigignens]|uniref:Uncharacterized protein n=1 Tax=Dehalogenimonas alkenigignens TaxID=1217799 RepID=A0A0W0GHN7_9CHLR|nr:hypothetical protein [Dehalogenimonas alkenigignens]KTB48066.1 hypothetical protein DEALK_09110 [Dehalogenimonas alkenigignens]PVV84319.1 hypothetical protein DD509_03220 [Dehalogenimonas alkenigignens]
MVKKNAEKVEDAKEEELEAVEVVRPPAKIDVTELMKASTETGPKQTEEKTEQINVDEVVKAVGGAEVAEAIKTTDIEAAVKSGPSMIEQIATQARLEAQRASEAAMKEYRNRLQGILADLQRNVRDEGARVADEICSAITEKIRRAMAVQTEKKAQAIADELILNWQIEAESFPQHLFPAITGMPEEAEKHKSEMPPVKATAESAKAEAQDETASDDSVDDAELPDSKTVFDFASFISRSKTPVKS